MKAAVFEKFQKPLTVRDVTDPRPQADSAIIRVQACGICRSDWHGWMGHDSDVRLPHVPGHELAGTIAEVGSAVRNWHIGDRVTTPFCCGCGTCRQCVTGNSQICDRYTQPGFTHWGAFAELVEIRHADVNLVALPESIEDVTAASLGCRFATAFRAIVDQGRVRGGEVVAVHGCGGVGLSAVMIAAAVGARVIGVDVDPARLNLASQCGADAVLNAAETPDVIAAIRELTDGGAHVSLDALGSRATCFNSVKCLRKRGRHVQVGLTLGSDSDPAVPMSDVIAGELEIFGSHGMPSADYPAMLQMIQRKALQPQRLIGDLVSLSEAAALLPRMNEFPGTGVIVIDRFS
ncbi:MAG: zinc-dependent alcohol dehydrogenase family protein [Planctomycetaceae bacterium]